MVAQYCLWWRPFDSGADLIWSAAPLRSHQGNNVVRSEYSVFYLYVQVESTTGVTGTTEKSKTKHPRDPRVPRGLLFQNTQVKNALTKAIQLPVLIADHNASACNRG